MLHWLMFLKFLFNIFLRWSATESSGSAACHRTLIWVRSEQHQYHHTGHYVYLVSYDVLESFGLCIHECHDAASSYRSLLEYPGQLQSICNCVNVVKQPDQIMAMPVKWQIAHNCIIQKDLYKNAHKMVRSYVMRHVLMKRYRPYLMASSTIKLHTWYIFESRLYISRLLVGGSPRILGRASVQRLLLSRAQQPIWENLMLHTTYCYERYE